MKSGGALYIVEAGSGEVGLLSERALLRLKMADVVVAEEPPDLRLRALAGRRLQLGDPRPWVREGRRVAWLVPRAPEVSMEDWPWEFIPAAAGLRSGGGCRPLEGWGVLVTRPRAQSEAFLQQLELLGARAYGVPSIELQPADTQLLDRALERLRDYHWLIFTSANAVEPLVTRLGDVRRLAHLRLAAIGPATAEALQRFAIVPDLVPPEFVAEGLLEAFPPVQGQRILLPRAAQARDVLPEGLRQRGAEVDVVPVYETVANVDAGPQLDMLFGQRLVDVATFTASSTVTHCPVDPPPDVRIVCIGPITARTARERGWRVDAQPASYTTDGLLEEILALARRSKET